jgi:hypothetical protein
MQRLSTHSLRVRLACAALVTVLVLATAWTVAVYGRRVAIIPALSEPFDVAAFLARRVSNEENAARHYREAVATARQLILSHSDRPPIVRQTRPSDFLVWLDLTPPLDEDLFLDATEPVWASARAAADMPHAMFQDPSDGGSSNAGIELSELRELAAILERRADILRRGGHLADALTHHLAVVALGRHCAQLAGRDQQMIGTIIESIGCHGVQQWAAESSLTEELAEQAFRSFPTIPAEIERPECAVMVEYLRLRRMLGSDAKSVERLVAERTPAALRRATLRALAPPIPWPFAQWELERGRRLIRCVAANQLAAARLEPWQRAPRVGHMTRNTLSVAGLFGVPPMPHHVLLYDDADAERLAGWLDDTPWLNVLLLYGTPDPNDMVTVRRRATSLILGLRAYQLNSGRYPDELESLQPQYFAELPLDPYSGRAFGFSVATGQMIGSYSLVNGSAPYATRAGQRLIYSVGPDGTDQAGATDWGYHFGSPADWLFPVPDGGD